MPPPKTGIKSEDIERENAISYSHQGTNDKYLHRGTKFYTKLACNNPCELRQCCQTEKPLATIVSCIILLLPVPHNLSLISTVTMNSCPNSDLCINQPYYSFLMTLQSFIDPYLAQSSLKPCSQSAITDVPPLFARTSVAPPSYAQ